MGDSLDDARVRLSVWQMFKHGNRWSDPDSLRRMAKRVCSIKDRLWAKRVLSKRLQRRSRLRRRFD